MGFNSRGWDSGCRRLLLQLQRGQLTLPGLRDTRLHRPGCSHQSPCSQRCTAGRHHAQQLQLSGGALLRSLLHNALEHRDGRHRRTPELLQLLQLRTIHLVLSACFSLGLSALLQSLLKFRMLVVDAIFQVLDDRFLCGDLLHQRGFHTVGHVQLEVELVHCVLEPIKRRMARFICALLCRDHLCHLRIHRILGRQCLGRQS
mmetsp:Transcript_38375/g.94030  ORF Transcript_38375/g.94030 Transcript_38375/m.94030 type:complete len:202 (-) Transcript_38375:275-880(-)